jgi:hypothetical protein
MPASEGEALLGVANFRSEVKVWETVTPARRQQIKRRNRTGYRLLGLVTGYWDW